jgi:hypothetical protein
MPSATANFRFVSCIAPAGSDAFRDPSLLSLFLLRYARP